MSQAEPFIERRLRLAGFGTRSLTSAAGGGIDGTVLLFLHGWSDSADTFKPLLRQLALVGIGGIALDLPGCGHADALRPGMHLPQFLAFACEAIEHFGDRVMPVGQSLGGRVMLMALAGGVRNGIPACVAIAPAPLTLPPWQKMLVRNAALASSVSAIDPATPLDQMIGELVQSFRRTCFVDPKQIGDEVFADYARHYTRSRMQQHIGALRQIGEELAEPIDLAGVKAAVDLVWGTHDRLAPLSGAETYRQKLPQSQLTVLQDCGHHAHLERAAEVAGLIQTRLASLALRASRID